MHFVLQHFFSLVLIDAECLNKGQTDRYHPLNWKIITAAPKRRNPRRSVNHYHLVLGHANSQSRWRNQVFSSTLEGKRDQRALISGIMEWKQELTEPSLHIAQQLLRSQRQKEESGPVTAPHSATATDNQVNMQLIQRLPLLRWI